MEHGMKVRMHAAAERGRARRCGVDGCRELATAGKKYFAECQEQIDAIHAWHAERQARQILRGFRRGERREFWLRISGRVRRSGLNVLNAALVIGVLLYVLCVLALPLAEWLRAAR